MTLKLECLLAHTSHKYEIEIGHGILNFQSRYLHSLSSRFAIITNETIGPLYGESVLKMLSTEGSEAHLFSVPDGETYKTRETKELLENRLLESGFGRDSCVIALGGGVVTDLAGYVAATYCRGLPLVMIPTSLLGMVDASIGGKTGVNTPYGKNLVGCIYQPHKVIIDTALLKSLPTPELANGIVEMIKHALIQDRTLFEYLEQHLQKLLALDLVVVEKAIYDSCRIKRDIVEQDEREKGKRHLLNFGHTVGHALELVTGFTITHGEAVAIGLLIESFISLQLGKLPQASFDRIRKILIDYRLPLTLPSTLNVDEVVKAMTLDKKSQMGRPRFVVLKDIGNPVAYEGDYCTQVDESLIRSALQWMCHDLCCR